VPADQLSSAFPGSRDKGADGFLRSNYKSAGQFCQQSGVRDAAVPNVSRPAGRGGERPVVIARVPKVQFQATTW
jgi:hypothetical protein